ncbi:MAG: NADH-quinone oxidoreductase subunit NuoE [Actinobacteria bacterium]|nr:NADH-quinone oxidoreductase subunit NuoE [Actinomycetota bacterium]
MKERLEQVFSAHAGTSAELIPILQQVQEEFGYLPEEAMESIARFLRVPASRVYAVASFYAQFRFSPMGRHKVSVCTGTACHVKGADRVLDGVERVLGVSEGETTEDGEYTLETVACIGCCGLAPVLTIDDEAHGRLTPQGADRLFAKGEDSRQ